MVRRTIQRGKWWNILMENKIGFWGTDGPYGAFSNFYPCKFIWNCRQFNCSEQAFMWAKARYFNDLESEELILKETDPKKIKALGRKVKNFDANKWSDISYNFMLSANIAKYQQNEELKNKLLNTGKAYLYEDSPFDYLWGVGKDGSGKNLLGKVLMEVREYFWSLEIINSD